MNYAIAAAALIALIVVYESCTRLPGSEALWRFVAIVGTVSIVFAADCVDLAYAPEDATTWVWPWLIAAVIWVIVRVMFVPKSKSKTEGAGPGDSMNVIELVNLEADSNEAQRPPAGRWAPLAGLGVVLAAIVAVGIQSAPVVEAKAAAKEAAERASQSAARQSTPSVADEPEEEQRLSFDGPFIYSLTEREPNDEVPLDVARVTSPKSKRHPALGSVPPKVRSMSTAALLRCLSAPKASDAMSCADWLARTRPEELAESMKSLDAERASNLFIFKGPTPIDELRTMEKTFQEVGVFDASRSFTAKPPFPLDRHELFEWQDAEIMFDPESGSFPTGHHFLLADIASLTRGALDGAAFEEIAPESYYSDTPYTIRAYHRGLVYSVQTEDASDWYDLSAVLGLVNTLLRDDESNLRAVSLYNYGDGGQVLVAPKDAILRALADGLLRSEREAASPTVAKAPD